METLRSWLAEDDATRPVVLDVRSSAVFARGHVPGSINVPLNRLPERLGSALCDKKRKVVCVCQGSVQSAYAVAFLYERGYRNALNLSGGFSQWQSQGNPVEA